MKRYILIKALAGGEHKYLGDHHCKETAINFARSMTTYTGEKIYVYEKVGHSIQSEAIWVDDELDEQEVT